MLSLLFFFRVLQTSLVLTPTPVESRGLQGQPSYSFRRQSPQKHPEQVGREFLDFGDRRKGLWVGRSLAPTCQRDPELF